MKKSRSARANEAYGRMSHECRMCTSPDLKPVLDLGHQPHSDSFPTREQLDDAQVSYPLRLVACSACGLLQIDYLVDPKILYQEDYLYVSSTTATGKKHYTEMAESIVRLFHLGPESLVIDIGSNVGVLLGAFRTQGPRVLGVDPAKIPVRQARTNGIDTVEDFFTSKVARRIKKKYGVASVITGTNVFAHLHELDDAVSGMKTLLAKDGVVIVEAPHALTMINNLEYDTIYHQHVSYLSVRPMGSYLKRMGLELFRVEELPIHGGSLRYFAGFPGEHVVEPSVNILVQKEEAGGIYDTQRLSRFARDVAEQKHALVTLLLGLKTDGKRVVALSAPAKGNTLLNYCHLDTAIIDYATERNPLKIGRYTPGTYIPIYDDRRILSDAPDYALILAWNFAEEIMKNMSDFKKRGGKFILPIPKPVIV